MTKEEELYKRDKRKACIWTTEAMIDAQKMMERAKTEYDLKAAEALFHMAMCVEFLLKDPRRFKETHIGD